MEHSDRTVISIIIPVFNEQESLPGLYREILNVIEDHPICKKYEWELLFVNDGSSDDSLAVIKSFRTADKRVEYLSLSRNFGKENAMLAGFDYAKGAAVIIMDADLQDPPKLIPEMIHFWENGYLDVYARRKDRRTDSRLRALFSVLFYKVLDLFSDIDVLKEVGDFRLLDRRCIDALKKLRETDRYTKGLFSWIGYKKMEIPYEKDGRKAGKSKWNFKSLSHLAINGITSFSIKPLRISTILGFIIALASFIIGLVFFAKTLIWGDPVRGFTTLIVVISFLGGAQLCAIGILGEYVGRIFNEVKHRPPYIIDEYNNE